MAREACPEQSRRALRYLQNAREILRKAPKEDDYHRGEKYVQEACGTFIEKVK